MFSNNEKPKIERPTSSNDVIVHVKLERVKLAYILFLLNNKGYPAWAAFRAASRISRCNDTMRDVIQEAPESCIQCVTAWRARGLFKMLHTFYMKSGLLLVAIPDSQQREGKKKISPFQHFSENASLNL